MPNTSSSVPFLLSSSMNSIRSRRPSACLSSSQGSGLLQQLGSGMVRQLTTQHTANGRSFPSSNVRQCPSSLSHTLSLCFSHRYFCIFFSLPFSYRLSTVSFLIYVSILTQSLSWESFAHKPKTDLYNRLYEIG